MSDPALVAMVERLRSLAEKATPGPWSLDYDHRDGGAHQIIYQYQGRTLTLAFMSTSSDDDDDSSDHDAAFVAACDPQTILALLDALSAAVTREEAEERLTDTALKCVIAESLARIQYQPLDLPAMRGEILAALFPYDGSRT